MEGYKNTPVGNVPQNWKYGKLSDFVELIHGYQFRTTDFVDDGIPIIKIGNVNNSNLDLDREKLGFIDEKRLPSFEQYEILNNDILMSLTGNIGRVVEVKDLPFRVLQNYRVGKFESHNENILLKNYIKFILSSPLVLNQLFKYSNQSAQANFGKKDMDKIKVVIPSELKEQKKIAEILSTVDEKIEAIDQIIAQTQELKKGLMQQLLTKGIGHTKFKDSPLGEIPESWEVVKFSDLIAKKVITKIQDGNHGESHPVSNDFVDEGIPFIMANCISISNQLTLHKAKRISFEQYQSLRIGFAEPNDVLLTHKGTVGLTAIVKPEHGSLMLTPQVTYYRIGIEKDLNREYLFYYFQSPVFQNLIEKFSKQSTRAYIGITNQKKLSIILPQIDEQQKISEVLSSVDKKLQIQQDKKAEYQELKKGLMQQLLTGKIRVKVNPN